MEYVILTWLISFIVLQSRKDEYLMVKLLQEKMLECYNCIEDIVMDGYESGFETVSSSDTPVNVLDRRFSSSESDKTLGSTTTITTTNTQHSLERDAKRRKMNRFCDDHQLSQTQQYSANATDFYS